MVRLDALSPYALGILTRLLGDDPLLDWILQNVIQERDARAAGEHALPLEIPVMSLEDARILNRHLIVAADVLDDLIYQPHDDNAPEEPFLEAGRFLVAVSEDLGRSFRAGVGTVH